MRGQIQISRRDRKTDEAMSGPSAILPIGDVDRKERRLWGCLYVRGLLLDGERKSIGAMLSRMPKYIPDSDIQTESEEDETEEEARE